jgi:hydroxyethylthiazole kinase-like uncharacterized protein yjeF
MPQYLPLFTTEQARAIDKDAQRVLNISEYTLMQRAGAAAWRALLQHWPKARRIGIACGPGNNGGDGTVLGGLAREAKREVVIVRLPDGAPRTEAARKACGEWETGKCDVREFDGSLPEVDLWVDALFGIGLERAPNGAPAALISAINASGVDVFALDVPSGVNADTGSVPWVAIRATRTLTFIVDKRGLRTGAALEQVGRVQVDALGVPDDVFARHVPTARLLRLDALEDWLPPRRRNSYKGTYGHVLCVGGEHGSGGAIALTSEAALRSGAGLVSVATRADHVSMLLARRPEVMVHGVEDSTDFVTLRERASVLAVGPGLGQGEWGHALLAAALASNKSLVLDADALNLLPEMLREKPTVLRDCVLTPHPGEAARLLDIGTAQVQADRYAAAQALATRYGCCAVLKGAGSIIAAPDEIPVVIDAGNPGMAVGGMGDVLTGVIAALRAQHLSAFDAAVCGTLLHALAGDVAAGQGGERGLLASDLFPQLRRLANPGA